MKYLTLLICIIFISCGPSKKELQDEIECKNDTIENLKRIISNQGDYIEELQEKLDEIKSRASDIQSSIDDDYIDDAYDAASDIESEAEYE